MSRISGSSSGAHYKNGLRQTEGRRLPESGPARCQSLQPPVSRLNHIPGTQQIPNICITLHWSSIGCFSMALPHAVKPGRKTDMKSCLRFNCQTIRGQHEKFTFKKQAEWADLGFFSDDTFAFLGEDVPHNGSHPWELQGLSALWVLHTEGQRACWPARMKSVLLKAVLTRLCFQTLQEPMDKQAKKKDKKIRAETEEGKKASATEEQWVISTWSELMQVDQTQECQKR